MTWCGQQRCGGGLHQLRFEVDILESHLAFCNFAGIS